MHTGDMRISHNGKYKECMQMCQFSQCKRYMPAVMEGMCR